MIYAKVIFVQIALQVLKGIALFEFIINPVLEAGEISVEMSPAIKDCSGLYGAKYGAK